MHSHSLSVWILQWHTVNEEETSCRAFSMAEPLLKIPQEESGGTSSRGGLSPFSPLHISFFSISGIGFQTVTGFLVWHMFCNHKRWLHKRQEYQNDANSDCVSHSEPATIGK
jgi:hypothetical protein